MDETPEIRKSPLDALHRELGGRMVPFAGWEMPLHYGLGILKEHQHCRAKAALFDVSHMGPMMIQALQGQFEDIAVALERILPFLDAGRSV